MAAKKEIMETLHEALAKTLLDAIKQDYTDEDGKKAAPPASILNVARQFLKDNGVEALPVPGSPLDGLLDAVPFEGEAFNPSVPN